MSNRRRVIAAVAACTVSLGALPALAGEISYNFASVSGESTPATLQGATFSSPSDPGAFTFGPNGGLFSALGPYVLSSNGAVATLDISFASPISLLSFDFALGDLFGSGGGDTLTVTANDGSSVVRTAALVGSDFFPEGSLTLSGTGAFTSVIVTSAYPIVIADMATVPEPATMTVLGTGLLALAMLRRRAG
ncbi:MAG TPA: PEP-CTERM sorting domain-containing protein [Acetobacteraceae bacterium]|jgi:hypothetical protein|nr:PEP-CTERM sorting domain-containing protein [Acetobacteraceae bacterium]